MNRFPFEGTTISPCGNHAIDMYIDNKGNRHVENRFTTDSEKLTYVDSPTKRLMDADRRKQQAKDDDKLRNRSMNNLADRRDVEDLKARIKDLEKVVHGSTNDGGFVDSKLDLSQK